MSDRVRLRPAKHSDIPALRTLIERSARGLSRGFYSDREAESAIKHVFGVDTSLVDDGTYYVLESDGVAAACGGWSRRRALYGGDQRPVGSVDELLDPARDAARIRAFFVSPGHARRGFGTMLLNHCVAAADAAGFTRLELMSTLPGVPFYEAMGFAVAERVDDVLPDGVPVGFVRMTRSLNTGSGGS